MCGHRIDDMCAIMFFSSVLTLVLLTLAILVTLRTDRWPSRHSLRRLAPPQPQALRWISTHAETNVSSPFQLFTQTAGRLMLTTYICLFMIARYSIGDGFTSACSSGYGTVTNSTKCLASNGVLSTTVVKNTQRGTGKTWLSLINGCRYL